MKLKNAATVVILYALIFILTPHQTKSSAYYLFKQNGGFGRTQRYNHADVVDIKSFTQHQYRHYYLWLTVFVNVKKSCFQFLPFLFAYLSFLIAVNGDHIFLLQPLVKDKLFHEWRNRRVFTDYQHLWILCFIHLCEVFF